MVNFLNAVRIFGMNILSNNNKIIVMLILLIVQVTIILSGAIAITCIVLKTKKRKNRDLNQEKEKN